MIGDKYTVIDGFYDELHQLYVDEGEILIERGCINNETEQREDGGEYNELTHEKYGYICDIGSKLSKIHLKKVI